MLSIWNNRHNDVTKHEAPRVAIIGEYDRRDYVKSVLRERVNVVGELVSDRNVHYLNAVDPDIVFLDCGSSGINPFVSLPRLAALTGSPLIVAFAGGSTTNGLVRSVLLAHGAHAAITIGDTSALTRIVGGVRGSSVGSDCTGYSPVAA